MPRTLLFALLVLVAAPLVLLGWLSVSAHRQQQQQASEQLRQFFDSRLSEIDRSLADVFDAYKRELEGKLEKQVVSIAMLQELDRRSPIVRSSIFVTARGTMIYPPEPSPADSEKVSLFAALPAIIGSKPVWTEESSDGEPRRAVKRKQASIKSAAGQGANGVSPGDASPRMIGDGKWQVWYMDEGVQLIYWMPRSDGSEIGVLLERARWIADLTAALPDTPPHTPSGVSAGGDSADDDWLPSARSGFTALTDEAKRIIYRWGGEGERVEPPMAARSLSPPLISWHLEYHSNDPLAGSTSTALVASLAGIGVVLLSLGAYVLTGVQRQMRAARQRVSFASQVSHELRTPLTNIRLYAELAESDLEQMPASDSRDSIARRLQVIDTESRRLGRLVSGVLEMIRDPRKTRQPRIAPVVPDEVIDQTLMQFAPSFEKVALRVQRDAGAGHRVGLDADILELILVNLLSNVEKYASSGDRVEIRSRMDGKDLVVQVFDQGPGITWHHRRSIFRPFWRLDDSIHAPSGTGIGLTIARRLARRHGGDLELVDPDPRDRPPAEHKSDETARRRGGACFQLRIRTTPAVDQAGQENSAERDP